MPVIIPDQDGIGRWELKPEGLVGFPGREPDDPVRLGLPVKPTGSYEMEVGFESREECSVAMLLCVGEKMIAAVVGGPDGKSGLHEIKNDPFYRNETTVENIRLAPDREHELHALVKPHPEDRVTIAVSLDGKMIIEWTGHLKELTLPDGWRLKKKSIPGIAIERTGVLFRRLHIRAVEGEVHILREPSDIPGRRTPILPRGGRGGRRRPFIDRFRPEQDQ